MWKFRSRRLYDDDELTRLEFVLSIAQQMVLGQIYSTNDVHDNPQIVIPHAMRVRDRLIQEAMSGLRS